MGPPCKASINGPCLVLSVADGTDKPSRDHAVWALENNQQVLTFIEQVKGILSLAVTPNDDAEEMLSRYRKKVEISGANVAAFDQAIIIARPRVKQKHLPKRRKSVNAVGHLLRVLHGLMTHMTFK